MVKAILMESQTEMRNMLLDTGGKVILVVKWQRTWLNCVSAQVFCGRQNNRGIDKEVKSRPPGCGASNGGARIGLELES